MHTLGQFEVAVTNEESKEKRQYYIVVDAHQYAILSLFNEQEEMTYDDIKKSLGCHSESTVTKCLLKLCNPKLGSILKKESKKAKFEANEKITLNKAYEYKHIRQDLRPERPKPSMRD